MTTDHPSVMPGLIRNPALEQRARAVAAAVLAASRGTAPAPSLTAYATEEVMRRLTARARTHRTRLPDPGYQSRTYLTLVNQDTVEACVLAFRPETTKAVAIRLERRPRGWLAVDFSLI
ncbi:MAG: Rv3235 family protein [Bifidobacteriaceae bacterium]|jgi:hypothetical protein|nr:Rv3235 family protein [Bifidobacteriaceae bacterium]